MKICIICHRPIINNNQPRGAENSVRIISQYLATHRDHAVMLFDRVPTTEEISRFDLVLTWGSPARMAARRAKAARVPLVLMVRFWKNIAPRKTDGTFGDLMTRKTDENGEIFRQDFAELFEYASAIITNSVYARSVIHRWQSSSRGKTHVSYVPIGGIDRQLGGENECLTIVTPEIYGEYDLVKEMIELNKHERFQVVNCDERNWKKFNALGENVFAYGYKDMMNVFKKTRILLVPVYNSDICGTRRVTIEAFRHGIPVLATDRSGMAEKVPTTMLMKRKAKASDWLEAVARIDAHYDRYRTRARNAWDRYDSLKQLDIFESILKLVYEKISP